MVRCYVVALVMMIASAPTPSNAVHAQARTEDHGALLGAAFSVVTDSLPIYWGEEMDFTRFVVDADLYFADQSRADEAERIGEDALRQAMVAAETEHVSWVMAPRSDVMDCVEGRVSVCAMDPSTVVVSFPGVVEQLPNGDRLVWMMTTAKPAFSLRVGSMSHHVILRFDGSEWVLAGYKVVYR